VFRQFSIHVLINATFYAFSRKCFSVLRRSDSIVFARMQNRLNANCAHRMSINQSIYLIQKQQNDAEQGQSLRVNWTQREVSFHWWVFKIQRKNQNTTFKKLNLVRSYAARRLLKDW